MRRGDGPDEELVIVINFDVNFRPSWRVPVPREGDYVEIFNSDAEEFGGSGQRNAGVLSSRPEDCDGRENSLIMNVPPLGGAILRRTGPTSYVAPAPAEKAALPRPAAQPSSRKPRATRVKKVTAKPLVAGEGGPLPKKGSKKKHKRAKGRA